MSWKDKTCGQCDNFVEVPPPPGTILDLNRPKRYVCRANPPNVMFAIGDRGGKPFPLPLTSMYPIHDELMPACRLFDSEEFDREREEKLFKAFCKQSSPGHDIDRQPDGTVNLEGYFDLLEVVKYMKEG